MRTTLPEVTRIVQRCEALFEDLNFEAVKAMEGRCSRAARPSATCRSTCHAS
jgi:hypothetical protein